MHYSGICHTCLLPAGKLDQFLFIARRFETRCCLHPEANIENQVFVLGQKGTGAATMETHMEALKKSKTNQGHGVEIAYICVCWQH